MNQQWHNSSESQVIAFADFQHQTLPQHVKSSIGLTHDGVMVAAMKLAAAKHVVLSQQMLLNAR